MEEAARIKVGSKVSSRGSLVDSAPFSSSIPKPTNAIKKPETAEVRGTWTFPRARGGSVDSMTGIRDSSKPKPMSAIKNMILESKAIAGGIADGIAVVTAEAKAQSIPGESVDHMMNVGSSYMPKPASDDKISGISPSVGTSAISSVVQAMAKIKCSAPKAKGSVSSGTSLGGQVHKSRIPVATVTLSDAEKPVQNRKQLSLSSEIVKLANGVEKVGIDKSSPELNSDMSN